MRFLDLYSCFPSAVEIGCKEIGISEDDPRGLTVTGGLPYFGGPGNSYVVHSISEMIRRVRSEPGVLVLDYIAGRTLRSEEHTSELQSLMRISYAVFCLKKKNKHHTHKIAHKKNINTI